MLASRAIILMWLNFMSIFEQSESKQRECVLDVSPHGQIYEGESVRLICKCRRPSADQKYDYFKIVHRDGVRLDQPLSNGVEGPYIIMADNDTVGYFCRKENDRSYTSMSDKVSVNVSPLPKATLTVEAQRSPLYPGENITLKCGVDSPNNWLYFWYKNEPQMAVSQSAGHSVAGDRYTITAAAGQYWCEARLEGRNVTSQRSDPVTVSALPKATLTVEPQWSPLYPGENITLKCRVDSPNNWSYLWYKDENQVSQSAGHSVTGDRYTITAAAESDQGQYWCEARLDGRNVTSQRSDPITLTVSEKQGRKKTSKDLSFPLGITLGALGFLIVAALILILFMKYCRNQVETVMLSFSSIHVLCVIILIIVIMVSFFVTHNV